MKYKNTKTGAIIDSPCVISGGDWIEIQETEIEEAENIEDTSVEGLDGVTKKEIMQELDAMGIEYDPRARKEILYDLMIKGR